MANEGQFNSVLRIRKLSGQTVLMDVARSGSFTFTVTGTKGPVPGAVTVTQDGVAADLSGLDTPGACWFHNMSSSNYVQIGARDPDSALFYPILELLPGERYAVRLARDLGEEYQGTGTGTGTPANQLYLKAFGGSAVVAVEAFDA